MHVLLYVCYLLAVLLLFVVFTTTCCSATDKLYKIVNVSHYFSTSNINDTIRSPAASQQTGLRCISLISTFVPTALHGVRCCCCWRWLTNVCNNFLTTFGFCSTLNAQHWFESGGNNSGGGRPNNEPLWLPCICYITIGCMPLKLDKNGFPKWAELTFEIVHFFVLFRMLR